MNAFYYHQINAEIALYKFKAMSITEQINEDIKSAMKAQQKEKLSALRDIKAKLLLEMTKDGGSGEVDQAVAMKILDKLYKQRVEAATIYKAQNREELYAEEMLQAEVIKAYLPAQLSETEIKDGIKQIIAQTGASSMADLGKVMGVASKHFAGKADGKTVADLVKSMLSGNS
jgi:uncharacterized protein YqeY